MQTHGGEPAGPGDSAGGLSGGSGTADASTPRPYYRLLGISIEEGSEGRSRVRLDPHADLGNIRGDVHGGAVASLLDAAFGVATRSLLKPGESSATVSLTINYVEPGRGTLVGKGRVVRAGGSLMALEAVIEDLDGKVVAHGVGTMRILRPRTGP